MFLNLYFCFRSNSCFFRLTSNFILTPSDPIFPISLPKPSSLPSKYLSQTASFLTLVHYWSIKLLKAIACLAKNGYLCIEMSWKGLISRMSDECLITLETVFSYCYDCQAVMRKFTLAFQSWKTDHNKHYIVSVRLGLLQKQCMYL